MKMTILGAALLIASGSMTPAFAQSAIAWPSEIGISNTDNPPAALGAPDGVFTGLGSHHFVWVLNFKLGSGSRADLEKMMGLAPGELKTWDIIAFEGQGGSVGEPFESSLWTFTDEQHMVGAAFSSALRGANPPGSEVTFKTGAFTAAQYQSLFPAAAGGVEISWILVKLPAGIDKRSPDFSVTLSGALIPGTEGSPDPDAIGVIW